MLFSKFKKRLDKDLLPQYILIALIFSVIFSTSFIACISKREARIPNEKVMHYPFTMAQNSKFLVVSASSADQKYDFGRLVTLDTEVIRDLIDNGESIEPMSWDKVIVSNVLISQDAGEISFTDNFIAFANRENSRLVALPVNGGFSACNFINNSAETCPGANVLQLLPDNPFSLANIYQTDQKEMLAISYLSSDQIDIVEIKKAPTKGVMNIISSHKALDWLKAKLDRNVIKNKNAIVRKIYINKTSDLDSKAYFLIELYRQKDSLNIKPKGAFIFAVTVGDLLSGNVIPDTKIEFWNLLDRYSIASALDLFIDKDLNEAYILGHIPEILVKIDLKNDFLMKTSALCTGATSMAIDKEQDLLVVPCFQDDRVAAYTMSSMVLKTTSDVIGRGPAYVVIDKAAKLIYCTFSDDGTLVVFNNNLKYLGHIFDKAPSNRTGS
jgi:hypothetical protein